MSPITRPCYVIFIVLAVVQMVVMITLQQRKGSHDPFEMSPIISNSLQEFMTSFKANITVDDQEEKPGWDSHNVTQDEEEERDSEEAETKAKKPSLNENVKAAHDQNNDNDGAGVAPESHQPQQPEINLSGNNIWDHAKTLPQWYKDYFNWHKKERAKITPENWREFKYLTMRCLDSDSRCGGTADRIKTIPYILYWAHRSKRILLIYWSRPCKIEEFLLPPEGGIDWRVPDWLRDNVVHGGFAAAVNVFEQKIGRSNEVAVRSKLQSYNGGSLWYQNLTGTTYAEVYHDVWRCLFTPSPAVADVIMNKMKELGLEAGNYVSAHLRGLYARHDRPEKQLRLMAENAVNCGSSLHPGGPIYFASDSKYATDYVVNNLAKKKEKSTKVVGIARDYEPLHLEKTENWKERKPSEYYDTFVDLYLLGLSRCVTYNVGGFGQWGSWMGYNSTCYNRHGDKSKTFHCDWTEPGANHEYKPFDHNGPILLPPMSDSTETSEAESPIDTTTEKEVREPAWKTSTIIPKWMKDYFEWHSKTKSQLTEDNWNQTKYLVMQCTDENDHCGGTSDRLQPLPLMIHLAAKNNRLLLIRWTKPCPLEEFLVPPPGGLDWRLPAWLTPHVHYVGPMPVQLKGLLPTLNGREVVVRTKYQSNNHGAEYFDEQKLGVTFREVYHDLFRSVFQPSKPVGELIDKQMEELKLVPGEYASAHFRVLYGREDRPKDQTKEVTINAINCASELRPGGPVYFAADQKYATDAAREYAAAQNLPVVMVEHEVEPLHLDKGESKSASDYYSVFVDLFLLGESRCLAFNNGGFGQYGLLLGYNSTCSVRHHAKKILKHCPKWISNTV